MRTRFGHSISRILFSGLRSPKLVFRYLAGKDPSGFDLNEIERVIGIPSVILEAGAFNGEDTAAFAEFWPRSKIFAFEPVPELFEKAVTRTSQYAQIKIYDFALVNKNVDSIELNTFEDVSKPHGSSSILEPSLHKKIAPSVEFNRRLRVPARQLDDWYVQSELKQIDLLWLDLQGAELEVLKSGTKCLMNTRELHIEVSLRPLYEGAPTFKEVDSFLQGFGFELKKVRIPVLSGNALFIKG